MSKQQEMMEAIEKSKSILLAQRDENNKEKSRKITETGQIIMTIENLYTKCEKMGDIFPSKKNLKDYESMKNFNDTHKSGEKATIQLEIVIQCLENFKKLKKHYIQRMKDEAKNKELQVSKNK